MMTPAETFHWVVEAIRRLFTTPIAGWTWGQWFLALFLVFLVSSCCCGGSRSMGGWRRYRARRRDHGPDGYYAYRSTENNGPDPFHNSNYNIDNGSSSSRSHSNKNNSSSSTNANNNTRAPQQAPVPEEHRVSPRRQRQQDPPASTPYRLAEDV